MVRYGKEQRDGAVGLYIRYERCAVDVIHELGYPGRGMLPVLAGSKEAHVTETSGEKPPTAGEGGGNRRGARARGVRERQTPLRVQARPSGAGKHGRQGIRQTGHAADDPAWSGAAVQEREAVQLVQGRARQGPEEPGGPRLPRRGAEPAVGHGPDRVLDSRGQGVPAAGHRPPRRHAGRVVVGLRPTSKSVEFAKEQGLEVKPVGEAVAEADVVMILLPDQYQAKVYKEEVEPNLKPGAALAFAHGFNIHYGYIKPSEDHPVFMVAPKGPGHIVRREYAAGRGVPVVVAVEQDPDGKTWPLCLAYAKALGALRAGAIKTTFTEETETDLFGEQDVLMGGINHLCDLGFDVLTEAGYQPEIAYFEVFHELKMLVDLANEGGLNKARWSCSDTAQYGDYTSTVITEETKKRMQYQLKRIQDGSFAKEFMDDQAAGAPKFKELQEEFSHPHLETVGPKLRAMFSWNNAEAKDKDEAESFNGKIARTQVQ